MFSDELITQIKRVNRIEDVVREFGVELKRNKALCPFHQEKDPSFSVDPKKQIARCFSCMDRAVDVIGFVVKVNGFSFVEAVEFLAQRAGIELEPLTPEQKRAIQKSIRRKEILDITVQFYHKRLIENKYQDPLGYIKERGFTKEILDSFKIGLAEKEGLRDYLVKSGISEEEGIEVGVLSVWNGIVRDFYQNRLIFPVLVKGGVILITARALEKNNTAKWLHLKGGINNLYNEDALTSEGEVLICEGASDVLTATIKGYKAVGVLGSLAFDPGYYEKFNKIEQVFVCFDADKAGKAGAKAVADVFMGEEKVIDLPEGQDLTEYFKTHNKDEFEKLKSQARSWQETMLDEEEATLIHLTDTDDAKYSDKKVKVDMMICAKGETFHVPQVFSARCDKECKNNKCPINKRTRKFFIPSNSKDLINFTWFSDSRILGRLRELSPCEEQTRKRIHIKVLRRVTVQEIMVIPKATRIQTKAKDGKKTVIDELGREYRDKRIYALASLPKTNKYFRGYGWVKSSPKSQVATVLMYKLEPIGDDYQNFKLDDETKKELELFQVLPDQEIKYKLNLLLEDITNHITEIYGGHRKRALLCMLLTYCSQIGFKFDGELLKRGWVEIAMIGDSGQGKTQLFNRLSDAIDLGEFISGTSASRTGICYACLQMGSSWFLMWGKYPLNDGKLLFIDEGQSLAIDEWNKMSSGRSDGVIRADRVKKGEHPTRTRLIVSCNPKDNRMIEDNMCGVETLKSLFRPADIRRFDIAIFLSGDDQTSSVINTPKDKRPSTEQSISSKALRSLVCWAWNRKPEDIVFKEEARKRIYEVADELMVQYGSAKDIPLVTTDIRHKVARLSVALATFLCSTDEEYKRVIVDVRHVEDIKNLMRQILDHENCCLNVYADLRRGSSTLSSAEYQEFLEALIGEQMAGRTDTNFWVGEETRLILLDFANNYIVERSQLAETLDLTPDNVSKKLKIFKDYKLIKGRSGKRGYRKTPKFNKIIRKMYRDGYLDKPE